MNVEKIIKKYLTENGYDGLFNYAETCGCVLEDLFQCSPYCHDCEPAYKRKNPKGGFDWIITEEKLA